MSKRIFRGIFLVSLVTILITLIFIITALTRYFDRQLEIELKSQAKYISSAVNDEGMAYFDSLSETGTADSRVTWIAGDGTVLYDSIGDEASMENHIKREEVQEAMQSGTGESIRYSRTLSEKTVYYATLLSDGSVLRVSSEQRGVLVILLGLLSPIIAIVLIAAAIAAFLSRTISKNIVKPINEIDLDKPYTADKYEELSPLLRKINNQNELIKEQMEELTRKQREFSLITENMNEGLLIIDSNAEVLSYNSAVKRMFDIKDESGVKNALMINRSSEFIDVIQKALDGRHSEHEMEYNGGYLLLIASPVMHDLKTDGAIIIMLDITEKQMRDELRRSFTSNVSHELKTPLTTIYGVADMLRSGLVKQEDIPRFANDIYAESGRMITLINDIIKLSKLDEESGLQEEKIRVDMYAVAKMTIKRLESTAAKKNVKLTTKGNLGTSYVWGVESMLEDVVYNLCDNSIKYNKENGSVEIEVSNSDGMVHVSVSDTGIGVPKNDMERIFERFYRVDKSHSRNIGGTGLGLSIVKHVVNYHEGSIDIESEEGKGTKITVSFAEA